MPIAYSLAYLTFSLLYYAGDGKYHRDEHSPYIYDVLDWSDPSGPGESCCHTLCAAAAACIRSCEPCMSTAPDT